MDMFLKQDELAVEQYASRKAMGEAAAKEVAAKIAGLQREKESVNIFLPPHRRRMSSSKR